MTAIIVALVGAYGLVIVALINNYFNKKSIRANTARLDQEYNLVAIKNLVEDLRQRDEKIYELEIEVVRLERELNECLDSKQAALIAVEIQDKYILKKRIEDSMMRVFILDDSDYTQEFFSAYFKKTRVIKFEQFTTIKSIEDELYKRPEILILDYKINGTIDELMKKILEMDNYHPAIIMISGMPQEMFEKLWFASHVYKFFNKGNDTTYITKTLDAVIKYIRDHTK